MGWCSGTVIFDKAMELFLEYVPENKKEKIIYEWYREIRDGDWDCVNESDYWEILKPILKKHESDYWEFDEDEGID